MDDAIRYMNEAWRKAIAHEARGLVERRRQRFRNQDKRRSDLMTTLWPAGALKTWKPSRLAGRPSGRRRFGMADGK
jgi:hypothetical protein